MRLDTLDHCDRVRARLPINRDVNLPFPLDTHNIGLDLVRIFDLRHIANVSRRPVADAQRQIIELRDRRHHAVGIDLIIERPEFRIARRDHHVEVADGVDDIERRQAACLRFQWVDIGENAPQPSAVNRGRDHAGD